MGRLVRCLPQPPPSGGGGSCLESRVCDAHPLRLGAKTLIQPDFTVVASSDGGGRTTPAGSTSWLGTVVSGGTLVVKRGGKKWRKGPKKTPRRRAPFSPSGRLWMSLKMRLDESTPLRVWVRLARSHCGGWLSSLSTCRVEGGWEGSRVYLLDVVDYTP